MELTAVQPKVSTRHGAPYHCHRAQLGCPKNCRLSFRLLFQFHNTLLSGAADILNHMRTVDPSVVGNIHAIHKKRVQSRQATEADLEVGARTQTKNSCSRGLRKLTRGHNLTSEKKYHKSVLTCKSEAIIKYF